MSQNPSRQKIFAALGLALATAAFFFNNCSSPKGSGDYAAVETASSNPVCTPPAGLTVQCDTIDASNGSHFLNTVTIPDAAQISGFSYPSQNCTTLNTDSGLYSKGDLLQVACNNGAWTCANNCQKNKKAAGTPCVQASGVVTCVTKDASMMLITDTAGVTTASTADGTALAPADCNNLITFGGSYNAGGTFQLTCSAGTWTCANTCVKKAAAGGGGGEVTPTPTPPPPAPAPAPPPPPPPAGGGGSSGGGAGCFIGGTQILLADGSQRNIEELKAGDLVLIQDEETGQQSASAIEQVYHHAPQVQRLYHFNLADGTVLVSNHIHPIFVVEKGAYFKAEQIFAFSLLKQKLSLLNQQGQAVEIKSIDLEEKEVSVYNFEVQGISNRSASLGIYGLGHNYFANGLLVHNALYTESKVIQLAFDFFGKLVHSTAEAAIKQK